MYVCVSVSVYHSRVPPFIDPTAETPLVARRVARRVAWPARRKRDISNRRDTLSFPRIRGAQNSLISSRSPPLVTQLDSFSWGWGSTPFLTPNPNPGSRDEADISVSVSLFFFSSLSLSLSLFHLFRSVKKRIRHPLHVAILNLAWLVRVYRDGCSLDRDPKEIQPLSHKFLVSMNFTFLCFFKLRRNFVDFSFFSRVFLQSFSG